MFKLKKTLTRKKIIFLDYYCASKLNLFRIVPFGVYMSYVFCIDSPYPKANMFRRTLFILFSYDILKKINKGGNIMLDLFLIIILIISIAKPNILLSKNVKEKASDDQKQILVKNYRKIYAILIALFESLAIMRYSTIIGGVLAIILIILLFTISLPATKQNRQIIKDLEI